MHSAHFHFPEMTERTSRKTSACGFRTRIQQTSKSRYFDGGFAFVDKAPRRLQVLCRGMFGAEHLASHSSLKIFHACLVGARPAQIAVGTERLPQLRDPNHCDSAVNFLPLAHEDGKCLLKIFAESYDASFVSSHDNNLSALHVGTRKELHYFIRQLRRSVLSCLRSCRRLIQTAAHSLES